MVESIKRNLSGTVGQNSLQKWLASPELASPVVRQSTELQIVQELERFQRKYRTHQDSQTLAGVETFVVFSVTVPADQSWKIDWLWVEHDSAATRTWQLRYFHTPFLARAGIVSRTLVAPNFMTPLIGATKPLPSAGDAANYDPIEPLTLLPGDQIQIENTSAMAVGEVGRLQVLYRHIPLPLEQEPEVAGLWQATTN